MRRAAQQALQTFTNFVDSDSGSDNEESDSELLNNLSQLEENNDSDSSSLYLKRPRRSF